MGNFCVKEDAHSNFSYSMTLCQRLCVQQVIEVGTGGERGKLMLMFFQPLSGRVWLHPPSAQLPGKLGLNASLQAHQGAGGQWGTRWYHLYTEVLMRVAKLLFVFGLHFPISLARTSLGFDLGDNTCAFCGPACREQDYEKLVKDKILQETIQYDIFRFLQPLSLVRAWKRVPEWKFTSCPSMSRP